jgi:hypothetical protein
LEGLILRFLFLKHFAVGTDFARFCLPLHDQSGGSLAHINTETLQVRKVETWDYRVKLHMRCCNDGIDRFLIPIYGDVMGSRKFGF